MKWLTRKNDETLFEQLDLKKADGDPGLKAELNKLGYVEWITYPIETKPVYTKDEEKAIELWGDVRVRTPLAGRSAAGRRKYEIFCGGFLLYHDMVFKTYQKGTGYTEENGKIETKAYPHKDFEHRIYFEWVNVKGTTNDKVTIYITETPKEFNGNPPPPSPPPPPEP